MSIEKLSKALDLSYKYEGYDSLIWESHIYTFKYKDFYISLYTDKKGVLKNTWVQITKKGVS